MFETIALNLKISTSNFQLHTQKGAAAMRQRLLYYARVKNHNIPNCYWQGLDKYDILRVTHKAGSLIAPDWYRKRADTGADRPCFCVCLLSYDLYLARERERRKIMGKQNAAGTMPAQRTFLSIRQLTVAGFLSAITIFLGLTGYGFIPLVIMNATILHIPTIIGSLAAGRKVGMIVGFMFGIFSFIRSLQAPSALLLFAVQYNVVADAFICIVPRTLIGLIAFEIYRHLKIREVWRIAVTAVLTTVCHTILFLGSFTAIVGVPYAEAQGIPFMNVINIMLGITAVNGIPEAVVSGLIITPIVMALHRAGLKVA